MSRRISLRSVPTSLAERYVAEGRWTDATLGRVLHAAARAGAEQPFRIWSDARPYDGTVGEVGDFARRVAGGLRAAGVGAGDVVTIQAPNWMETVAVVWATSFVGAVTGPLIDAYSATEVQAILNETSARVHIAPREHRGRRYADEMRQARPALASLEHVWDLESLPERFGPALDDPADVDPSEPAVLCYTSGSSAAPKGVIHTHRTFLAEVRQQLARWWPDSIDRDLVVSPIGHMAGMVRMVVSPVLRGHPIYGADRWQPDEILRIVRESGLTTGSGVPYFLASLLEHPGFTPDDVEHVRYVGTGGAPIPEGIVRRADELGISLVRGYGATEHPTVANSSHQSPRHRRLFTEGEPLPGVEIRILGDDGAPAEDGAEGELWTRGPDLCMGYVDTSLNIVFDDDGWFQTGDLAAIDPSGALVIKGRSKDIVIRGGENISARYVESELMKLAPIAEAAVVPAPDERFGERVCAFVRITGGGDTIDLASVRKLLQTAGVGRLAWPEELHVVEAIPHTAAGKIDKNRLKRTLSGAPVSPQGDGPYQSKEKQCER